MRGSWPWRATALFLLLVAPQLSCDADAAGALANSFRGSLAAGRQLNEAHESQHDEDKAAARHAKDAVHDAEEAVHDAKDAASDKVHDAADAASHEVESLGHSENATEHEEGGHHGHDNSVMAVHFWALNVMLPICICFLIALVLANQLHRHHVNCIPESLSTVFVGMAAGLLIRWIHGIEEIDEEIAGAINSSVLNLLLLPVIIYESGWSLRRQDFASQIVYILIFAIAGTVISVLVVGFLIHITNHWHGISSLRVAFAYASLISAVDPVATLATYSSLQVEPLLNTMVFGESVVNDAVAIVLFQVLNSDSIFGPPKRIDESHAEGVLQHMSDQLIKIHEVEAEEGRFATLSATIALEVLKLLFGSILLGVGLGIIYILILKFFQMRESVILQILYVFISCFLTYSLAEGLPGQWHMSGIISVLFCSIMMSTYAKPHLSIEGAALASFFLKNAAMLADMAVFLLVGVAVTMIDGSGMYFSLFVMGACLIGRFFAVYPLGVLVNCIKRCRFKRKTTNQINELSCRHLFMMWHAGLRGGIAFVLCMELGDWVNAIDGEQTKLHLRTATFMVVVVFLFVFGGTTKCMLQAMKIPYGQKVDHDILWRAEYTKTTRRGFEWLNENVFHPLLVGDIELKATHDTGIIGQVVEEAAESQGRNMYGQVGSSDVLQEVSRRFSTRQVNAQAGLSGNDMAEEEDEEEDDESDDPGDYHGDSRSGFLGCCKNVSTDEDSEAE